MRAAFLASEWRPAGDEDDKPTRFNETFSDKLADQLPMKAWPVLQIPFFVLSSVLLLISLLAFSLALLQRLRMLPAAVLCSPDATCKRFGRDRTHSG